MVMDIVGFYLPPDSGERVSFKITLLLGYSVFLIIVSDTLPATAIGTPLIGNEVFLFHRTWPDAFQKDHSFFISWFLNYVWEVTSWIKSTASRPYLISLVTFFCGMIQYSSHSAGRSCDIAPVQIENEMSWVFQLKSIRMSIDFQYGIAACAEIHWLIWEIWRAAYNTTEVSSSNAIAKLVLSNTSKPTEGIQFVKLIMWLYIVYMVSIHFYLSLGCTQTWGVHAAQVIYLKG